MNSNHVTFFLLFGGLCHRARGWMIPGNSTHCGGINDPLLKMLSLPILDIIRENKVHNISHWLWLSERHTTGVWARFAPSVLSQDSFSHIQRKSPIDLFSWLLPFLFSRLPCLIQLGDVFSWLPRLIQLGYVYSVRFSWVIVQLAATFDSAGLRFQLAAVFDSAG